MFDEGVLAAVAFLCFGDESEVVAIRRDQKLIKLVAFADGGFVDHNTIDLFWFSKGDGDLQGFRLGGETEEMVEAISQPVGEALRAEVRLVIAIGSGDFGFEGKVFCLGIRFSERNCGQGKA